MVSQRRSLMLGLVLLACGVTTAQQPATQQPAQQQLPVRQPAVWGLSPGNRFVVKTTVVRTSSVQIADAPPQESTITDEFEVEYFVTEVSDEGQIILRVHINPLLRTVAPAQELQSAIGDLRLPLLRNFEILMLIGPDGVVEEIGSRQQAIETLAGLDVPNQQLLLNTCSDGVVGSWFAHPFWLTAPAEELQEGVSWERIDRSSMGLLGELQTTATLSVKSIDAHQATVEVRGSSRLIEPVSADESPKSRLIEFSDVTVQVDDFSGSARMEFHAPPPTPADTPQLPGAGDSDVPPDVADPDAPDAVDPDADKDPVAPIPRPWFEEMTVRLSYSGKATVAVNGQKSQLQFTQQQTTTSKLQMYQIQRPVPDIRSFPSRLR